MICIEEEGRERERERERVGRGVGETSGREGGGVHRFVSTVATGADANKRANSLSQNQQTAPTEGGK